MVFSNKVIFHFCGCMNWHNVHMCICASLETDHNSHKEDIFCELQWEKIYGPFFCTKKYWDSTCLLGHTATMVISTVTDRLPATVAIPIQWYYTSLSE